MIREQDIHSVKTWLMGLQDSICEGIEQLDGEARFMRSELPGERGGIARPRVLEGGAIIEKAAVNFSHAIGDRLPPAATAERPELAGCAFQAVSTSLIIHPRNPYAPTSHANFRLFLAQRDGQTKTWWFGGGFDLTPYYPFEDDARDWHQVAAKACEPFGAEIYPRFKSACDKYFYLPHRKEPRGIGGIFYDDFNELGFEQSFALTRACGEAFLEAYLPIARRRVGMPHGERERQWQLYRRGRYVEFNLVYDRGTKYGLQSGSRIESILASMPPLARWQYDYSPEAGSPEAQLYQLLEVRDWLDS